MCIRDRYVVLVPLFGLFFRRKVSGPVWIAVVLSVVSLYLLCIKGGFSLAPGEMCIRDSPCAGR